MDHKPKCKDQNQKTFRRKHKSKSHNLWLRKDFLDMTHTATILNRKKKKKDLNQSVPSQNPYTSKDTINSQVWWHTSIASIIQEADAGGLLEP